MDKMEAKTIAKIYKIRWQIELIFKVWKSIFGIDNVNPMRYERLMATLNAKLLMVLVNWETILVHRAYLYKKKGKLLSINKCFKTLKDNSLQLTKFIDKWSTWNRAVDEMDNRNF